MFANCCQAQIIPSNRYRNPSTHTGLISEKSVQKDGFEEIKGDQGQFSDTPLKIKLLDGMGLREFIIDKFVFARPQLSYKLQIHPPKKFFTFTTTKLKQIPGYQIICDIIDLQTHFIPVIHFKKISGSTSEKTDLQQLKLIKSNLTIIYSHGNSSNLQLSFQIIEMMIKKYPINYIIYDYTGYGNGCGKKEKFRENQHRMSDMSICNDLVEVIKWSKLPVEHFVLWGYSLGCHPSIYAATKFKVNSLIIQSPFSSIYNMVKQLTPESKPYKDDIFDNLSLIPDILCDCLLIHSQDDDLVPIEHSRMLLRRFNEFGNSLYEMRFIEIGNIKHNEMPIVFCVKKTNPLQEELMKYLISKTNNFREQKNSKFRSMKKKQIELTQNLCLLSDKLQVSIENRQISELSKSIFFSAKNSPYLDFKPQKYRQLLSMTKKSQNSHFDSSKLLNTKNFEKGHLNITVSTQETQVSDEILLSEKKKHQIKLSFQNETISEKNSLKQKKLAYSFSVN